MNHVRFMISGAITTAVWADQGAQTPVRCCVLFMFPIQMLCSATNTLHILGFRDSAQKYHCY